MTEKKIDITAMEAKIAKLFTKDPIKICDVIISSLIEQRVVSEKAEVARVVLDSLRYLRDKLPKEYNAIVKADKLGVLFSTFDYLHYLIGERKE